MSPKCRRYLTFSLRTTFVLTTALAVWLGVIVNRACEQREAVKAIEALGGSVAYDWQIKETPEEWDFLGPGEEMVAGRAWLRHVAGDDLFHRVEIVAFATTQKRDETKILESIPYVQRLGDLKIMYVPHWISKGTAARLKAELPKCDAIGLDIAGLDPAIN